MEGGFHFSLFTFIFIFAFAFAFAMLTAVYPSPCGPLLLRVGQGSVCLCDWLCRPRYATLRALPSVETPDAIRAQGRESGDAQVLASLRAQLDAYFGGELREFSVPLHPCGTSFQREVWEAVARVPYGSTLSYGAVARCIGRPRAVRAVARAVGANPLALLIPCHRILGTDGSLTGYAGGLPAKRWLLRHEGLNP